MSRERDGGREPRKDPVDRLSLDRARDGKAGRQSVPFPISRGGRMI